MANESTAIVELISLVRQKPVPRQSDDDMLFAPTNGAPPRRAPRALSHRGHGFDEEHAVTHRVVRRDITKPLFAATLAVASVAAFGLTVRLTRHAPAAAALAPPAQPVASPIAIAIAALPAAPAPSKPVVSPIDAPPAPPPAAPVQPALIAIALESQPAGATVTLVDRGSSSVAGTTPLSLSVDPSREYDVVFTLAGHPTKLAHVDPHATTHLAVDLAPVHVDPDEPAQPAPRHHAHGQAHAQARTAAVPAKGTGTLLISSKPPCEIAIDGKPTGMVTPQRSISLAAGHHQVTLTNAQQHVKKTYSFEISANHSTKLIRDLLK